MKLKFKKIYWLYLIILLFIAFLIWIFMRPVLSDSCSVELNACLLNGKIQSFLPRMWSGIVCTIKNLGCLIGQAF